MLLLLFLLENRGRHRRADYRIVLDFIYILPGPGYVYVAQGQYPIPHTTALNGSPKFLAYKIYWT